MIVSYQTGMEFLQDNQEYLQTNPYLSTFFTLDALLLKQADKINYALRCEQGDKRLLALKIEPYNLLLFGEEACVPELLRFLKSYYWLVFGIITLLFAIFLPYGVVSLFEHNGPVARGVKKLLAKKEAAHHDD